MKNEERAPQPDRPRERDLRRRPYRPPRLTEYGPVVKLTQMGTGSLADGMGAFMMNACL